MIETIQIHSVVCDNCKSTYEGSEGFSFFHDFGDALNDAQQDGWNVDNEDEKHYCEACHVTSDDGTVRVKTERFKEK